MTRLRQQAGGLDWHVEVCGTGPDLLLLHGTGASIHSWEGLLPCLSEHFRVVAPDLPGHAGTSAGEDRVFTLEGMAEAVGALLQALEVRPAWIIGHSAGAAVATRLCLDGHASPQGVISLNGALLPFRGPAGQFFSPMAKFLVNLPVVPALFALQARHTDLTERLLRQTGSRPPTASVDAYRRLTRSSQHVQAALRMMANWDLEAHERRLKDLEPPLHLVACSQDLTVPPEQAERLARLLPNSILHRIPGLGHLGHEEDPAAFCTLIRQIIGIDTPE